MNKADAVEVLRILADSLRERPPSFSYEIRINKVVGTNVSGSLEVTAVGGGPGSNTTGYKSDVTVGGADYELVQRRADDALNGQVKAAADAIALIAAEMERDEPDQGRLHRWIDQLPANVIGGAIVSIVEAVVAGVMRAPY